MKFTLVFPSAEATDLSVGLVFAPCAMWVQGGKTLLNPHPAQPHYQAGDLQTFLAHQGFAQKISPHTPVMTLVIHPIGHGSLDDMSLLLEDLEAAQFRPVVVQLA
jgi:hypothetical protein